MKRLALAGVLAVAVLLAVGAAWAADTTLGPPPNSYRPMRCALQDAPAETLAAQPAFTGTPLYGSIPLGDGEDAAITLVVDLAADWTAFQQAYTDAQGKVEMSTAPARIYVDANNDEDLTNDGDGLLSRVSTNPSAPGQFTIMGSAECQVGYSDGVELAYPVSFYMFPQRAKMKQADGSELDFARTLFYYRNASFEGKLSVGGAEVAVRFLDENSDALVTVDAGDQLAIDLNGDAAFDMNPKGPELYGLNEPFNLNGESYVLTAYGPRGGDPQAAVSERKVDAPVYILEGKPAPDFTMPTLDGGTFTLSAQQGKVVVLDFWATWCGPCRSEMPNVVKMWEDLKDDGLLIVGISLDRDPPEAAVDAVTKYAGENGMTWTHIVEGKYWDSEIGALYQVYGIPHTVLVGKDGTVAALDLRGEALYEAAKKALGQ
jgi:thiol-disulfide isomerase/thioredoxin